MQLGKLSGDGVEHIDHNPWRYVGYYGAIALCRLQMLRKGDTALVMFTELEDNPGTSVTNASEKLATMVVQEFELAPHKCLFVEHYPADRLTGKGETYSIVNYEWENADRAKGMPVAREASWEHLEAPDASALLLRLLEKANG